MDAADKYNATILVGAVQDDFPIGTRLRKKSGSQWQGFVVGYYSSSLTTKGVAVESETHRGSVQIYPATAMEIVP